MPHLVGSLRGFVKPKSIHIGNIFSNLHNLTVVLLLTLSILVASRQYFGKPIDCIFEDYENGELNDYCFVAATFVREQNGNHAEVSAKHTENNEVRNYCYYSWVFLALFLQAVFFYIPNYTWKAWEGGRIEALSSKARCRILDDDVVEKEAERLSKYFFNNFHYHNVYAYQYFTCELLNLINVVCQILFMNRFIGEGFQLYGIYFLFMNRDDMEKRIGELFPKTTVCAFEKYSTSGVKTEVEGICLLADSPLYEKIYVFLWFWVHFVAVITVLNIIYQIITIASTMFRFRLFLRFLSRDDNADEVRAVVEKLQIGDWFLLLLLQKNVNSQVYKALISRLAQSSKPDVLNYTSQLIKDP